MYIISALYQIINFNVHLADAFIQSDLQLHSGYTFLISMCSLGIEPTTFCAADTMLYHWATQEHLH